MSNHRCNKCENVDEAGYRFDRKYAPTDCLLGKRSSKIWIIGLNPATERGEIDTNTINDLESYFDREGPLSSYFRDFRNVSKRVFDGFGEEGGTAFTDIVKCGSKRFPGGKVGRQLIENCSDYLKELILELKPQLVICNGSPVSNYMKGVFPPNSDVSNTPTSYWTDTEGVEMCVVLTGFIGRIDNYSRQRLGVEIENRLTEKE